MAGGTGPKLLTAWFTKSMVFQKSPDRVFLPEEQDGAITELETGTVGAVSGN